MRWLAIASCVVAALATALDAGAAGGHGSAGGRGSAAPAHAGPPPPGHVVMSPNHFHGGTRVIVGGAFFVGGYPYWPGYWPYYGYGPYYPPGYYPPVMAAPPVAPAPTAYWYYCAPLGAYYPYVPNCPSEWQLVEPYPY